MILLHLWDAASSAASVVELVLVVVTTLLILALHIALLRMYRDTRPESPRAQDHGWDDLRRLRQARSRRPIR
jgi:hypothetical protein